MSAPTTRLLDVPSLAEGETIYCHPVTSEESLPESPLSTQLTSTRVAEHHTEPRQATATSNESWGSPGPAERDLRLCPDEISNAVIIPTDHSQSWSPYPKSVNHLQRLLSGYARSASAGKPAQTGQMESTSPTPTQIESSRSSSSTITPKRFASGAYGTLSSDSPSSNLASPTTNASADRRDGIDESAPLLSRRRSGNVEGADPERQPTPEASKGQQHEGQPEVRKLMPYIFPAMAIGVFLSAADQTVIASSYGKIGSDLDALNKTSWIATAYFLTLTSFQPLYGKLSDIFSRKSCLLVSYLIFGLGCLFCGLSQNVDQLILARAFAGIGGGGMTTVVSIILSDAIPLQDRGTWQGFINIIYAAGAGTGAPLGGFLADSIGWRWSFLAQAPLCLIALIAVALVLKLPERDHEHWLAKLRRVDFLGALVLVMAVFLLLWGMDRGANVSWTEKSAYIPVIVSLPLFALFLLVEAKVASEPFAPGHIIFARHMVFAYAGNFFAFAGYIATVFYLPLFFQAVRGLSATQAGFFLLPGTICSVSGSLASGFYMKSTGRYYWLTVAAYSTLLVGLIVLTLSAGTIIEHVPLMVAGTALAGLGSGIGVTTTLIALSMFPSHDRSRAPVTLVLTSAQSPMPVDRNKPWRRPARTSSALSARRRACRWHPRHSTRSCGPRSSTA